jgi:hypothetical protein
MLKKNSLRLHFLVLVAIMATFAAGCSKKPAAEVNGAEITDSVLKWHLIQRIRQHSAKGAVVKKQALREAVPRAERRAARHNTAHGRRGLQK